MPEHNDKPTCAVCRIVRLYLIIAVPLIIAVAFGPESSFLTEIDLLRLVSYLIGLGFVATVAWRAYQEYWRK
jgi:hypothetical protein